MSRKATSVTWSLDDDGRGYTVRTYFDDGERDTYQAGNHPDISDAWLPADDPRALDAVRLAEFARTTARETAELRGLSETEVYQETPDSDD